MSTSETKLSPGMVGIYTHVFEGKTHTYYVIQGGETCCGLDEGWMYFDPEGSYGFLSDSEAELVVVLPDAADLLPTLLNGGEDQ